MRCIDQASSFRGLWIAATRSSPSFLWTEKAEYTAHNHRSFEKSRSYPRSVKFAPYRTTIFANQPTFLSSSGVLLRPTQALSHSVIAAQGPSCGHVRDLSGSGGKYTYSPRAPASHPPWSPRGAESRAAMSFMPQSITSRSSLCDRFREGRNCTPNLVSTSIDFSPIVRPLRSTGTSATRAACKDLREAPRLRGISPLLAAR
jgi:hypothetical protein